MLTITIPGRAAMVSHKNNYRLRNNRIYRSPRLNQARQAIGWAARQAILETDYTPLDERTNFAITVDVHSTGYTPDLDGVLTTVLDALEGIAYPDDKRATETIVRRVIVKRARDQEVQITINPRKVA